MSESIQRYISKELFHFVGRKLKGNEESQYDILRNIIMSGLLKAPSDEMFVLEIDYNSKISENELYLPYSICFCDIPCRFRRKLPPNPEITLPLNTSSNSLIDSNTKVAGLRQLFA